MKPWHITLFNCYLYTHQIFDVNKPSNPAKKFLKSESQHTLKNYAQANVYAFLHQYYTSGRSRIPAADKTIRRPFEVPGIYRSHEGKQTVSRIVRSHRIPLEICINLSPYRGIGCVAESGKTLLLESPLHLEVPYRDLLSDIFCILHSNQTLHSLYTIYKRVINTSCRGMKKHLMNWGQKEMSGCMMHEKCNWAVYKTWLSGLPSSIPMWGLLFATSWVMVSIYEVW